MANGAACFEFLFPLAIVVVFVLVLLRRTAQSRRSWTHTERRFGRRGRSRFERRWTHVYGAKTPEGEQIVGRVSASTQDEAKTQIHNRQEKPLWLRPIGDEDAIAGDDEESQNTPWKCQNDKCMTMNAPHARFCKTCGMPRLRESE